MDPKRVYAMKGLGEAYLEQNNLVVARKQYAALLPLDKALAAKLLAKIDAAEPKRPY